MAVKSREKSQKRRRLILKAVISATLLIWLLSEAKLQPLIQQWKEVNWLILLSAALALHCVAIGIDAFRWQVILKRQDLRLPTWALAIIYLKGAFLGTFLPGGVGGDVYRMYALSKMTQRNSQAISSVLVERAMGVFCLLTLSLMALGYSTLMLQGSGFDNVAAPLFMLSGAFAAGGVASFVLLRSRYVRTLEAISPRWLKLGEFLHTIPFYFSNPTETAKIFLLSMSLQLLIVLWSWVVAESLHYSLPFDVLLVTVPMILLFTMLPFSINGIGVREAAHVIFLQPFGLSTTEAVSFSLLSYSIFAAMRLFSGVLFFFDVESGVRFGNKTEP